MSSLLYQECNEKLIQDYEYQPLKWETELLTRLYKITSQYISESNQQHSKLEKQTIQKTNMI